MGVLPLQFKDGGNAAAIGLTGQESFSITGFGETMRPRQQVSIHAVAPDGTRKAFTAVARLDSAIELDYYRNGGILPTVLRSLLQETRVAKR
jgi:aconitate hydratase